MTFQEAENCLRRILTVAQAEAEHLVHDHRLGNEPIPFGWNNAEWRSLVSKMQPDDDLWEFDSPQSDWDQMMGSAGIALVRNGKVIHMLVSLMN